jgi:molybdopterin synthase sulfur carrier subunit
MKIKILAFGIAREICGARSFEMDIPEDSDSGLLLAHLGEQYPQLRQLAACHLAINETYSHENTPIKAGDTIAILPPVSGG